MASNSSDDVEGRKSESFFCLIGNIPMKFHSSDLRNFFSCDVEALHFDCFHFRHRPQEINISNVQDQEKPDLPVYKNTSQEKNVKNPETLISVKQTLCSIVRFRSEEFCSTFIRKYHGKYWMDKKGNDHYGRCIIQKVRLGPDDLVKFSKELKPPGIMPRGNVGTPVGHFLDLIKQCRLPSSLVTSLDLRFPTPRKYKRYSKVPLDYGTDVVEPEVVEDEEEILTATGHAISNVCVQRTATAPSDIPTERNDDDMNSEIEDNDPNADDDRCEDWERHEALNDDVTSQERLKERLYEDEIELVWEKGGPGLVWYTDAQYWDAQRGGFDERTADDLDVDMEGYYVPGAGDKDARDALEIRRSERFQKGLEEISVFKKQVPSERKSIRSSSPPPLSSSSGRIGTFETFTKGFGRKLMERQGWTDGSGLGKSGEGIKDALQNDGQPSTDKCGLGYYGEPVQFNRKPTRPKPSHAANDHGLDEDGRVVIGTIYDNPTDLDREETNLRSNTHTFIKCYDNRIPSTSKLFIRKTANSSST